jgi:antirestriction protein ArdC
MSSRADIYQIITDRIISRIETEGQLPWQQPWANYNGISGQPQNFITKKPYRGCNVWILSACKFNSPYWLTFKQAQSLGGTVKKGEKGIPVVYWQWIEKKSKDSEGDRIPLLKYFTVFNIDQCEGFEKPELDQKEPNQVAGFERAEEIVQQMPNRPELRLDASSAYYSPASDIVHVPSKESFTSVAEFYNTTFHELIHATGHSTRCARMKTLQDWHRYGSDPYAKEELVAEMGASFLCGVSGISPKVEDNSLAYLQGWISRIRGDKKLLIQASAQAQKAADFILGTTDNDQSDT